MARANAALNSPSRAAELVVTNGQENVTNRQDPGRLEITKLQSASGGVGALKPRRL